MVDVNLVASIADRAILVDEGRRGCLRKISGDFFVNDDPLFLAGGS